MKKLKNSKNNQYINKQELLKLVTRLENQLIRSDNIKDREIITNNINVIKDKINLYDRGIRLKSSVPYIEKYRKDNIKNETPSESKIKALLDELKIDYEYQSIMGYENTFFILDFYIPKLNVCIEVDGKYHFTEEQLKKDKNRDLQLNLSRKIKTIRITNENVNNLTSSDLNKLLIPIKKYKTQYILNGLNVNDNHKIKFGKYKGLILSLLKDLDIDYYNWLISKNILIVKHYN